MEFVKSGQKVLYVWGGEVSSDMETQVNTIKSIENVEVNVENMERLEMGKNSCNFQI